MTRITSAFPKRRIPQIETLSICFQYESENFLYDLEAQVEKDGPESYTCVNIVGAEDVADPLWRIMAEKAEELAWQRDNAPKNKAGCECPPHGEGTLAEMIHDDTCPIKLSKDEREAWREQERSDARYESDHEQANIHDSTWVYLNLK